MSFLEIGALVRIIVFLFSSFIAIKHRDWKGYALLFTLIIVNLLNNFTALQGTVTAEIFRTFSALIIGGYVVVSARSK